MSTTHPVPAGKKGSTGAPSPAPGSTPSQRPGQVPSNEEPELAYERDLPTPDADDKRP